MTELSVEVANLGKNFGPVRALHDVTFQVQAGSYFVLLGPSGGGKTTLLRLIGGFERPSRGTVRLMGQDVTQLPPNERGSSMVFQSYALFPHMNVERNVGYGLKLRRTAKEEIARQVGDMLELVGLGGLNRRMPNELSGGQQQRVQLARSLVLGTRILLLDEPLASLDAKLRKEMCLELKHIQERVGITFIHVTHNQEEAMTVANRIAIIADGRLVEEATPQDIYVNPQAAFTAEFIGENNLLPGRVVGIDGDDVVVDVGFGKVRVAARGQAISQNADVTVSIRSEKLNLLPKGAAADGMERLPGTLAERVFLGLTTNYLVRLAPERTALLRRTSEEAVAGTEEGGPVELTWNREDARLHTF